MQVQVHEDKDNSNPEDEPERTTGAGAGAVEDNGTTPTPSPRRVAKEAEANPTAGSTYDSPLAAKFNTVSSTLFKRIEVGVQATWKTHGTSDVEEKQRRIALDRVVETSTTEDVGLVQEITGSDGRRVKGFEGYSEH